MIKCHAPLPSKTPFVAHTCKHLQLLSRTHACISRIHGFIDASRRSKNRRLFLNSFAVTPSGGELNHLLISSKNIHLHSSISSSLSRSARNCIPGVLQRHLYVGSQNTVRSVQFRNIYERICCKWKCNSGDVETEIHFLIECTSHTTERQAMDVRRDLFVRPWSSIV